MQVTVALLPSVVLIARRTVTKGTTVVVAAAAAAGVKFVIVIKLLLLLVVSLLVSWTLHFVTVDVVVSFQHIIPLQRLHVLPQRQQQQQQQQYLTSVLLPVVGLGTDTSLKSRVSLVRMTTSTSTTRNEEMSEIRMDIIDNDDYDDDDDFGNKKLLQNRNDALAYHHYASMAVDLSNGHVVAASNDDTVDENDDTNVGNNSGGAGDGCSGVHMFTVTRSVRDIDHNVRRKYLYTIPFSITSTTTTMPTSSSSSSSSSSSLPKRPSSSATPIVPRLPPHELPTNVILRLPSPSGKYIALFRNNEGRDDMLSQQSKVTTTTTILEIWDEYGMSLLRRIELSTGSSSSGSREIQHGKVICDTNGGFGIPSWNHAETCIVYVAEDVLPKTKSFFDSNTQSLLPRNNNNSKHKNDRKTHPSTTATTTKPVIVTGGQHVMGIGQYEHYGEKYKQHIPYHGLFIVHIHTGKVGTVNNVPDHTVTILGQPIFCPPYTKQSNNSNIEVEESIVYTGWGSNRTTNTKKRLGLIYCQQRPCQLYHSKITYLIEQLSKMENDDDDDTDLHTDPSYTVLTNDMKLSHSPRFTPISTKPSSPNDSNTAALLVFLTSRNGFDTHSGCFAIGTMNLSFIFGLYTISENNHHNDTSTISSTNVVVDEVWEPPTIITGSSNSNDTQKHFGTVAGLNFPGLFLQQLPQQSCFLSSEYILTTTQWGSCLKVVRVSILTGTVHLITLNEDQPYSSDEVLYCNHHGAVINTKTPNQPTIVHYVTADQLLVTPILDNITDARQQPSILVSSSIIATFSPIASSKIALSSNTFKINNVLIPTSFDCDIRVVPAPSVDGVICNHNIQSILLLPKNPRTDHGVDETSSTSALLPPLIVIPHGGPHSASITNFVVSYAYLCGYGRYAILLVNYRGSTGYGQASIQSLLTNIGTLDIQDVIAATNDVCDAGLVDANRIGICGGSHGGFITAHLTGQYPTMFKAAVMRNPVVNLPSMVTSTDIPDWCYVEACGTYNFDTYRPPTLDELQTFYKVSPSQYVHRVQTPTLIALGLKDLRVPPSQGMEWYHSLRNRDDISQSPAPPTKLLLYENDDHAIDGVASEADHWVHIKQWFDQYLQKA